MQSWLKIPAKVSPALRYPTGTRDHSAELAPYVAISKAIGSIKTDPDVNSLVWQGP